MRRRAAADATRRKPYAAQCAAMDAAEETAGGTSAQRE